MSLAELGLVSAVIMTILIIISISYHYQVVLTRMI